MKNEFRIEALIPIENEERIEPTQKDINLIKVRNIGRQLGLKDIQEESPRQVLEVVNREYINLWGS